MDKQTWLSPKSCGFMRLDPWRPKAQAAAKGMVMTLHRAFSPYDWAAVLSLIQTEFAYMNMRINPASSVHRLTAEDIAAKAQTGEVWVIGAPPRACMMLTPQADSLYLGKLAVQKDQRGQGLARILVTWAEERARALGYGWLELETRIELTENHAAFRSLGFVQTGSKAHAGFDRPTSLTFRKPV
jgi:GNAT superfamily N-acetyltransferase